MADMSIKADPSLEVHKIFDKTFGVFIFAKKTPVCLMCAKRPTRIALWHCSPRGLDQFQPILIEHMPDAMGVWLTLCDICVIDCLQKVAQRGPEAPIIMGISPEIARDSIEFIRTRFLGEQPADDIPSREQVAAQLIVDEMERERDRAERNCCCLRHDRLCVAPEESQAAQIARGERGFADLACLDATMTIVPLEICQWLLWVYDDPTRAKMVDDKVAAEWRDLSHITRVATIQARIFEVRTGCPVARRNMGGPHVLPRPYASCKCDFHTPHAENLQQHIKYALR